MWYRRLNLSLLQMFIRRLEGVFDAFKISQRWEFLIHEIPTVACSLLLVSNTWLSESHTGYLDFLRITAVRRTIFYANNVDNSSTGARCSRIQVSVRHVAAASGGFLKNELSLSLSLAVRTAGVPRMLPWRTYRRHRNRCGAGCSLRRGPHLRSFSLFECKNNFNIDRSNLERKRVPYQCLSSFRKRSDMYRNCKENGGLHKHD